MLFYFKNVTDLLFGFIICLYDRLFSSLLVYFKKKNCFRISYFICQISVFFCFFYNMFIIEVCCVFELNLVLGFLILGLFNTCCFEFLITVHFFTKQLVTGSPAPNPRHWSRQK